MQPQPVGRSGSAMWSVGDYEQAVAKGDWADEMRHVIPSPRKSGGMVSVGNGTGSVGMGRLPLIQNVNYEEHHMGAAGSKTHVVRYARWSKRL